MVISYENLVRVQLTTFEPLTIARAKISGANVGFHPTRPVPAPADKVS